MATMVTHWSSKASKFGVTHLIKWYPKSKFHKDQIWFGKDKRQLIWTTHSPLQSPLGGSHLGDTGWDDRFTSQEINFKVA